jgi:ubiquinol-cytochrome c reductase cytochrome c subunit
VSRPFVQLAGLHSRPAGAWAGIAGRVWLLALIAIAGLAAAVPAAASPAPVSGLQSPAADVGEPAGSGSFTPAPTPGAPAPASAYPAGSGGRVYAENCSGCHGPKGEGLVGPPLAAAGFASLVGAMVEQGGISMPPFAGVLSDGEVNAVADFVAQELADPAAREAEVSPGGDLYRLYCSGCHSATGRGGALTRGRNAPNIAQYPAAEALAAMILGRGNMPAFAGNTLDVKQQAAVARYVEVLVDAPSPGGHGLGYLGPVPEGAVGAVALLLLILLAVWLAWPSRKAAP